MSIEADFDSFIENLIEAAVIMDDHYFRLTVAGREEPVLRERVYCYELYHQLRVRLGDSFPYKLDGEVDKKNHPHIEPKLGAKKPDFIIHVPGDMKGNLVVIEVKHVNTEIGKLRKDLRTLDKFLSKANYHYAMMLIYGDGQCGLPNNLRTEIVKWLQKGVEKKKCFWHQGPRIKPTVIE